MSKTTHNAVVAAIELIDVGQTQAARDSLRVLEMSLRSNLKAKELEADVALPAGLVAVDREALTRVLSALSDRAPTHLIRELQFTQGVLFPDNPITVLCNQLQSG